MKVLITGGAGFIGSHIADYFVQKNHQVVVFDNLSTGKKENVPEGANLIKGSVTNLNDVAKAMKGVDYVFHLAAMVSVPLSFENPNKCEEINVFGTKNILESALKNNVKKVIFSSSASIYGDNINIPLDENEPYASQSPYAQSKMEGEKLCQEFSKKGLKTCALRYFNVYGPRQDPSSPYSGVISVFVDRAKDNKDIIIHGDGKQARDFVHVSDVVQANVLAMKSNEQVMNVGTGKQISIKELAEQIINLTNSSSKIIYSEKRGGDIEKSCADISRIQKEGFGPADDLEEGLKNLTFSGDLID